MLDQERLDRDYPSDVQVIHLGTREIILIGTAHISRDSVDLVRRVIKNETPDCVCVELDAKRYETLSKKKRWESLDLKEIIRKKQLSTLLLNLMLASYQKKLGDQLGVLPGTELLAAVKTAEEKGIPIALCDRDVRVTLRRAWHATSFFKKNYLLASLFAGLFDRTEITEEKLNELKKTDVLSELMLELGQALPELKRVLIDERDTFLSERIKNAEGERIVAVVGAGHVDGIKKALTEDRHARMEEINVIPPVSPIWRVLGWSIPAVILTSIGVIAWNKGCEVAGDNIIYWILANGIPSSIGAMLALAHPLTIVSAFAAAPVTSLTPVIGAGYVTAFVQVLVQPPVVREFETVLEDMSTLIGWWKNKLLKVFLAFLLPGLGSMIGSWIGGYEIISNLF
ncbi:MAG: TraB/GumN family protein [Thermodesulfobacteriota bacterium]|nr:TraB/GumN family protein [Thermodesulfobacteriota bacterium]